MNANRHPWKWAAAILMVPALSLAQQPERFTFEVVSVRPHKTGDKTFKPPVLQPGGRFVAASPLLYVIEGAYDIPQRAGLLVGGPDWIKSLDAAYDIEATAPPDSLPAAMPASVRIERARAMVQAMLADRFKLAIHRETKTMPVYAIVAGKGGPRLEKAEIEEQDCGEEPLSPIASPVGHLTCHQFTGGRGRGLHGAAVTLTDLANFIQTWMDRPIIDQSGISGLYKIDTTPWLPIELGLNPPPPGAKQDGADMADLPTIFGVFEKLGLKLEGRNAAVGVYVIDRIEKPDEN